MPKSKKDHAKYRKGRTNESQFKEIDNPGEWGEEKYGKFIDGLPDAQKNGINHYTKHHYEQMNAYLRGLSDTVSASDSHAIESATAALEKSRAPENIVAFRGMRPFGIFNDLHSLKIGTVYQDKGFTSTSIDKSKSFSGIKVKIHIPKGSKGAYVDSISAFRGEKEFLIPPGAKFRVKSVDAVNNSITVELLS